MSEVGLGDLGGSDVFGGGRELRAAAAPILPCLSWEFHHARACHAPCML